MRPFLLLSLLLSACNSAEVQETAVAKITASVDTIAPEVIIDTFQLTPIDYDTSQWTELIQLDTSIVLDIRYATNNNFVKEKMYECGRCFLRPAAAKAVIGLHQKLKEKGLKIKLYDCFRPRPIQWKLWKKIPDPRYVSDPRKGSMHNRGAAVDLTFTDMDGKELDMGTDFDFFGIEAYHEYQEYSEEILNNRKLLKESMESIGFKAIRTEWWHYSYQGKSYEISDMVWNCEEEVKN